MRWTGKGHFTTSDGHTVYFSGNEKGGKKGVAFIANQHTAKRVLGYNPINDRLISLRLQAKPINITIIQVYAPTSSATDDVMDEFYNQLQDTLDTASKEMQFLLLVTSMRRLELATAMRKRRLLLESLVWERETREETI